MPGLSKTESDEIWEELHRLDGAVRAIEAVLIRQISDTDSTLRHHAEGLAQSIERLIGETRNIPPNAQLLQHLRRFHLWIRNVAEAHRQERLYDDASDPAP